MKTFISYIAEGGNIKVGEHEAAPFKMTAENRDSRVKDIHDSMHELNKSFRAEHGHDLFHGGKAHYGGSSMQLMDKNIPAAEFAKHKPQVGDVDVHVPHEHGDKLHAHLKTGARFGKYTVAGTKKHGIDVSAVMQHDNGELHQIDFIKGKHGRAEQSFLHSSHWDDVKRGVKGSHHKLLLNVAAGDTHKFSISGGLKSRTDENDKGHQHPDKISKALFGKDADHSKIHSFHGLAELVRDHIPASKHQDIYNRFKSSTDRAGRDTDHTKALAHLKKTLNARDEVNESLDEEKIRCESCKGRGMRIKFTKSGPLKVPCGICLSTGSLEHRTKALAEEAKVGSKIHITMIGSKHHNKTAVVTSVGHVEVPRYLQQPEVFKTVKAKTEDGHDVKLHAGSWRMEKRKSKMNLMEETEHHASVIPLVGFSPISHMGHAHDLGGAMKKLPGKKHIGISQKDDVFSPEERSHIMKKQWGQEGVNHHFTKSGGDTIGHAYHSLPKDGKKHLHILVGGDRVEMAHGLKKSLEAGKIPEMNGHKWDSIHIHTPEDSNRKHGMSGTNLRSAAVTDDHEEFHRHLGHAFSKGEADSIRQKVKSAIISKKIKIKR